VEDEDLVYTMAEATASAPSRRCPTCGRTCTLIARYYFSSARNDTDTGLGPDCVWCGADRFTFGGWTGSTWETWHTHDFVPPRMAHIVEFLRVAALERPDVLLPTLDRAVQMWTEVFEAPHADPHHTKRWTLWVLNPHASLHDVRRYLAAKELDASPVDRLPDPVPPSETWGHLYRELGREREMLRAEAQRLGPGIHDQKYVTTSDGETWVAYHIWQQARVGKVPEGGGSGSWWYEIDPQVPPSIGPNFVVTAPPARDHELLVTYLREFDPVTHAFLVEAWHLVSDDQLAQYYDEDVLAPADSVAQLLDRIRQSRARLASRLTAPDERALRASLVDPVTLTREWNRVAAENLARMNWNPN
jgi:hypothetical protein